jgi:ribA/ribD-fused uncharacterized protein
MKTNEFNPSKNITDMESITPEHYATLCAFLDIADKDAHAEVEFKLLADKVHTKDVVDRLVVAARTLGNVLPDQQYLSVSYPENVRVVISGVHPIHKVCTTDSYTDIPLSVERKEPYNRNGGDVLALPEILAKCTLRRETHIRKDYGGHPSDPRAHFRLISRKSFQCRNFRIDISMVKSKGRARVLRDVLHQAPTYEVEVEYTATSHDSRKEMYGEMVRILDTLLKAYYQTNFLLTASDIQTYEHEFRQTHTIFFNPTTMVRAHIRDIAKGYTVTVKADGERSGLYVARNGRVLKITPKLQVVWTGLTADPSHAGDFLDGEYIPSLNLFCIFDMYRYKKQDIQGLPLMTTDDTQKSRLGCAFLFLEDVKSFKAEPGILFRIERKLFKAGDGHVMEKAIRELLDMTFEYETDGLVFTPRSTGVAPQTERNQNTWVRVYKWKPADQNSIDFLVRYSTSTAHTMVDGIEMLPGQLYVSRNAGDVVVYPRETMTGEYVPPPIPADFDMSRHRVPSVFQPSAPRDPDAFKILLSLQRGIPVDAEGLKIESDTIIECAFDTTTRRWSVMRTRYDKTYQYRGLGEAQYGNDVRTANSIWTSMHSPVTIEMLTAPTEIEDDTYYRDDIKRESRTFQVVYKFHNRIKEDLYKKHMTKGDTLLELAVGKGGDLQKWLNAEPSRIVGMDISLPNLDSVVDSASKRYLDTKRTRRTPPLLLLEGDFTHHPLFAQADPYMPILLGAPGSTEYLKQFEGLSSFDDVSCQFAMHYACATEETFRNFAKNIRDSCKTHFFGTCSDGQAIYSLLLGKETHMFMVDGRVAGQYTKKYQDKATWEEEFGMPVQVYLESFVKPETEYLVPFEKVVSILGEMGFELVDTKMFSEIYGGQTQIVLENVQKEFSFLNRAFAFKRMKSIAPAPAPKEPAPAPAPKEPAPAPAPVPEPAPKEPAATEEDEPEPAPKEPEPAPVKRKLVRKKPVAPEPEPVLFFGADESKGEYRGFSNMAEYPTEIDGTTYPTNEHYFQAMKAVEFKDADVLKKIMAAKSAKSAKALGRKVKNFNPEVWDTRTDDVMRKGVRAKFVQHPDLRTKLMETGDKPIGEANARDSYWGIGTGPTQAKAKTPSKWPGQNKLGKILMELRTTFKEEA